MKCIICAGKISCRLLEEFTVKTTSINLIGTFSDSASVSNLLSNRQDIDLVFLDLDLLEIKCFDFIRSLNYPPNIIMVSSNDQYAMKAFDLNVVDYLIKPVTYSRFCKAVNRAIRYYSSKEIRNSDDKDIFIKKGSSLVKLKLKDIIYIEALENYIILNTSDGRFTIHFTMKAIENQLPAGIFIRVNRSFIVNKNRIQTIKNNSLDLIIGDELKEIHIGSSFKDGFLNKIKMINR